MAAMRVCLILDVDYLARSTRPKNIEVSGTPSQAELNCALGRTYVLEQPSK